MVAATNVRRRRAGETLRNAGFTLTELMVVVVLMGVLVVGVMGTFAAQKRTTGVNSQVVDAQHATRLIGDLLEEDIRHTGMMVPEGGALCAIDRTSGADTLFVTDAAAIDPSDEIRNDLGARIGGGGNKVSSVAWHVCTAGARLGCASPCTCARSRPAPPSPARVSPASRESRA